MDWLLGEEEEGEQVGGFEVVVILCVYVVVVCEFVFVVVVMVVRENLKIRRHGTFL